MKLSMKNKFYHFYFLFIFIIFLEKSFVKSLNVIDQFANQSQAVIASAAIPGVNVRQCICDEQRICVSEMKTQAMDCINTCWKTFSSLTQNPNELRKCFAKKDNLIENFITCFQNNVDACLKVRTENNIQKLNITKIFELGIERIEKKKGQFTKLFEIPIKKIFNTAGDFGICVKDCFLEKNKSGFCFDKKDCQPLLLDKKARKSLHKCIKIIDWKKEAGELCDCSVKAGLSDLKQYCPMLRLIGGN